MNVSSAQGNKSHTNDAVRHWFRHWAEDAWQSWNAFWFTPQDAATLGLIRILAGAMLLYTHFVWSLDLTGFFGGEEAVESFEAGF